jgi:hypothetical protein
MSSLSITVESPPDDSHIVHNINGITPLDNTQVPTDEKKTPTNSEPSKETTIPNKEEIEEQTIIKYSFKQVAKKLQNTFLDKETNNSTICDIIAMYLKGQKILYTEAKTVCEQRLNYLMLPAIFITSVCAILTIVIKDATNGPTVVASLNGLTAFILSLINYLKLDAKAEAHRTSAYKFDKLQSTMEFNSGRILFDEKASKELIQMIQNIETNVKEIKETNQFILPERIRYTYPNLYNMNVFAEVKKIGIKEMIFTNKLLNAMNESLELQRKYEDVHESSMKISDVKKLDELDKIQKICIEEIIKLKNEYLKIDEAFELEMKKHRESTSRKLDCCSWLKS